MSVTEQGMSFASFELDQDLADFRAVCRSFVAKEVKPLVREAETRGRFPLEILPKLAAAGMLGLGHPAEDGGQPGGMLARAVCLEELAKSSGGIAVTVGVSSYMAGPHLSEFGNAEQRERYLRPVLRGEGVVAVAVTEPGAGSDVAGISATAKPVDGGWKLNGTKMFITNAGFATVFVIAAKTDPDSGHRGISTFIVEPGDEGLHTGEPLAKMGWHSSDTRELVLDDLFVPDERLLGELGRGFHQIMHAFERERVILAAMGVGLADAAIEEAMSYARERKAFGAPIGQFQAVSHPLTEMLTDIAAARLLVYQAAERFDTDHPEASTNSAMAKLLGARVACRAADVAVQVLGGAGYIEETPISMHYRDARILRIGGGSDEVQMNIMAKRLGLV
jgi:acyl-CoA dehydrogenase/citronellyl-CoA dehydrogenase